MQQSWHLRVANGLSTSTVSLLTMAMAMMKTMCLCASSPSEAEKREYFGSSMTGMIKCCWLIIRCCMYAPSKFSASFDEDDDDADDDIPLAVLSKRRKQTSVFRIGNDWNVEVLLADVPNLLACLFDPNSSTFEDEDDLLRPGTHRGDLTAAARDRILAILPFVRAWSANSAMVREVLNKVDDVSIADMMLGCLSEASTKAFILDTTDGLEEMSQCNKAGIYELRMGPNGQYRYGGKAVHLRKRLISHNYMVRADRMMLVCKVRAELQARAEEHLQAHVACCWQREELDLALPYATATGIPQAQRLSPVEVSRAINMPLGQIEDLISSVFEAVHIANKGMYRSNIDYFSKRTRFLGLDDDCNKTFVGLNSSSGCDGGPIESGASNRVMRDVVNGTASFSTRNFTVTSTADSSLATYTRRGMTTSTTSLISVLRPLQDWMEEIAGGQATLAKALFNEQIRATVDGVAGGLPPARIHWTGGRSAYLYIYGLTNGMLVLRGHWLAALGLREGDRAKVTFSIVHEEGWLACGKQTPSVTSTIRGVKVFLVSRSAKVVVQAMAGAALSKEWIELHIAAAAHLAPTPSPAASTSALASTSTSTGGGSGQGRRGRRVAAQQQQPAGGGSGQGRRVAAQQQQPAGGGSGQGQGRRVAAQQQQPAGGGGGQGGGRGGGGGNAAARAFRARVARRRARGL